MPYVIELFDKPNHQPSRAGASRISMAWAACNRGMYNRRA
jgi:hypothetical protein